MYSIILKILSKITIPKIVKPSLSYLLFEYTWLILRQEVTLSGPCFVLMMPVASYLFHSQLSKSFISFRRFNQQSSLHWFSKYINFMINIFGSLGIFRYFWYLYCMFLLPSSIMISVYLFRRRHAIHSSDSTSSSSSEDEQQFERRRKRSRNRAINR